MDDNLDDLYQEIILSHNKRPRNEGVLEPSTHCAEGYNPLCGDRLTVYTRESGPLLEAIRFTGEGCAISRASASIMTDAVQGLSGNALRAKIEEVIAMLSAKEDPQVDPFELGELAALLGVRKFPARVKCATLAWHTLAAALREGSGGSPAVSTE